MMLMMLMMMMIIKRIQDERNIPRTLKRSALISEMEDVKELTKRDVSVKLVGTVFGQFGLDQPSRLLWDLTRCQ